MKDFRTNIKDLVNKHITAIRMKRLDRQAIPCAPREIRLFIKARNESLRLPYLLKYYFSLGVDRAFVIDNYSKDDSVDYLLSQKHTHVFRTHEKLHKESLWRNMLLQMYGLGHWCVVVDADELLVYPRCEDVSLRALCDFLEQNGYNTLNSVMLDLYADKPFRELTYAGGEDPLKIIPYFDRELYNTGLYIIDGPFDENNPLINDGFIYVGPERIFGGVRRRMLSANPLLTAFPLVKYSSEMFLTHGKHRIEGRTSVAPMRACLLHTKFLGDFVSRVHDAVKKEQYWQRSREYKEYKRVLDATYDMCFYFPGSEKYVNSDQLVKIGFMKTLPEFETFADKGNHSDRNQPTSIE